MQREPKHYFIQVGLTTNRWAISIQFLYGCEVLAQKGNIIYNNFYSSFQLLGLKHVIYVTQFICLAWNRNYGFHILILG